MGIVSGGNTWDDSATGCGAHDNGRNGNELSPGSATFERGSNAIKPYGTAKGNLLRA